MDVLDLAFSTSDVPPLLDLVQSMAIGAGLQVAALDNDQEDDTELAVNAF